MADSSDESRAECVKTIIVFGKTTKGEFVGTV